VKPTCEFLEHAGPIPIAHRGGMGEGEEFALVTIERALALGCYIEVDVSATADGVPVLWHPRGLDRARPGRPLNLDAEGLRIGDLNTDRRGGDTVVHRLADVLGSYTEMRALIDVKKWSTVEPVAHAIAATKAARRVSIGTFSQARTDATAKEIFSLTGERVCTAMGPAALARLAVRALVAPHRPWQARAHSAQAPYRYVTERLVVAAHCAGSAVLPWTVNNIDDMRLMIAIGVDGLITDYPSRLIEVLSSR
jgi:glycerophosphoryl diester phosphodiesterase